MQKTLKQIHEDVPALYYDLGIKNNIFQKIWHTNRFLEVKKFSPVTQGKILDIGCHSGLFTKQLTESIKPSKIYGIDISESAISSAKHRIKGAHFYTGDAHNLPFKNSFFDKIFCLEMLEHVENPSQVVSEIKRVLKKNGTGIILIPTESYLFRAIWFFWNITNPVWKHAHVQHFSKKSLSTLLKRHNLKITKSKTIHYNMLYLVEFVKA